MSLTVVTMTNKRLERLANNLLVSLRVLDIPIRLYKLCLPGDEYGTPGFQAVVMHKLRIVHELLAAGHTVLWTDVDIAFRRDPREDLLQRLEEYDVVFQPERNGKECTGFFAVKPSEASRELFDKDALIAMQSPKYMGDQLRVQRRIRENPSMARIGYLPDDIYPDGWRQLHTQLREDRFITHYNYRKKTDEKIDAMKKCGDWFLGR